MLPTVGEADAKTHTVATWCTQVDAQWQRIVWKILNLEPLSPHSITPYPHNDQETNLTV